MVRDVVSLDSELRGLEVCAVGYIRDMMYSFVGDRKNFAATSSLYKGLELEYSHLCKRDFPKRIGQLHQGLVKSLEILR